MSENYEETEEYKISKEWHERAKNITLETLSEFLKELCEYPHNYNTIVSAIGAGAVATCWAMNGTENGGITGFQASCVMWDFIANWMQYKIPMTLVKYEDMLYPQYDYKFSKTINKDTFAWLQEQAEKNLKESKFASPYVIAHWKSITDGEVPFGYKLRDE